MLKTLHILSLHKILRSTLVALALVLASVMMATRVDASGGGDGCYPGRADNYLTYYWDGAYSTPGKEMGGVYADIENYSPYVYADGYDNTSEWVMLAYEQNSAYYAQDGWIEYAYGQRYTFDEISFGSTYYDDFYPPYNINSYIYYDTLYDPSTEITTFEANNHVLTQYVNYFTWNEAQVYAELWTQASQVPGGYYNGNHVQDMHGWYGGTSGGWYNFNGDSDTSPTTSWMSETPWFKTGVNSFVTWDQACPY